MLYMNSFTFKSFIPFNIYVKFAAIAGYCTEKQKEFFDILIDGPFINGLRDLTLQFRGSSNQRVIDMNETRKTGKLAIWKG